jgi:outer membrane protein assembly factor BamB
VDAQLTAVGRAFTARLARRKAAPYVTACVLAAVTLHAEDWPQFRGPTGQGHSTERNLPLDWSETQNVAWKTAVPGLGWSSPVVAGGRVWLTTSIDSGARAPITSSLRVLAYDAATGKEVVNVEVFRNRSAGYINPKNSRASPTPILEGDRVYVHFGQEGTAALTTSGEILWKTQQFDFETQHGAGGSPVLYGDLLIFNCDGWAEDAFVVALDKNTGRTRWRTNRRRPFSQAYTTPLVIRAGDRDQLISIGAFRTTAYDPLTGREIWRVGYQDGFSNVPRPVFGHGLVYIATGFNDPTLIAVRPDGMGDVTKTHLTWTVARGAPFTPSPLLVGDELYMVSDIGVLSCLDARTGATLWQARVPGNYSASPVFADGRIYLQSEEGVTTVVAPGKEFRRLSASRLDGAMLATMAVSNGSLFIRTDTHLYRIGRSST